jgi:hypothetical protein
LNLLLTFNLTILLFNRNNYHTFFSLFTINFNGAKYSAVFSGNKEALDYDTDSQTGAVVLNMRKIVITKQGGAITFADFIAKNNGGRFAKKSNYATILLMSVTAKELNDYYFKRAINNGTFSRRN